MKKYVIIILVMLCLFGIADAAISISGSVQSGAYTQNVCTSMDRSNDPSWPLWGQNASKDYTYGGSESDIITNGQTIVHDKSRLDQSSSNNYAKQLYMATDGMAITEDTVGMMNIQPNEPASECDQTGYLGDTGGNGSGSYPVSEALEGRTGAVFHDGGSYSSEVGIDDATVHLKGDAYANDKAFAYTDMRITAKKGFDKDSLNQNTDTSFDFHEIARTANLMTGNETALVYENRTIDYTTAAFDFDEVLSAIEVTNEMADTGISEERLNDYINETTNETAVE